MDWQEQPCISFRLGEFGASALARQWVSADLSGPRTETSSDYQAFLPPRKIPPCALSASSALAASLMLLRRSDFG